jgi:DNA modification methylase
MFRPIKSSSHHGLTEMECLKQETGKNWTMINGDCCQVIKGIPDNSIDFCCHSPPFAGLYIYSPSEADLGNCSSNEEFIRHYEFLIAELYRVTVPGRLCAIHVKDLPLYLNRDDAAGLIDLPGMCIQAFTDKGWTFHSRVTIWKCPVTERERTNNHGLLHKTILKDSSGSRQGMADYLIVFRKGNGTMVSDKPVHPDGCVEQVGESGEAEQKPRGLTRYLGSSNPLESEFHPSPYARTSRPKEDEEGNTDATRQSITIWRRYAEPVWWDIDQTDVLNYKPAREHKDERHICPLQMGVIERAIHLWTNPGDVVLTPFGGIGSELVGAIRQGRKAIGIELKEAYFNIACRNCRIEESKASAPTLFDVDELGE